MSKCQTCKRSVGSWPGWFIAWVITSTIIFYIGIFAGWRSVIGKIEEGTHTIEVQKFSDGANRARLVETRKEPQ